MKRVTLDRPFVIAEIVAAQAENRNLDLSRREPRDCAMAIHQLIANGQLDAAAFGANALARAFPSMLYARNMSDLLSHLPADGPGSSFADDPAKPVQVVPRPDAKSVIFVFGCPNGRFDMPFGVAHLWLCHLPASLVYLRDPRKALHLRGIETLAEDRSEAASRLHALAESLGADRISCIGHSLGGYSALVYGIELEAHSVVSFSGATDFTKPLIDNLRFTKFPDPSVFKKAPDLRRLYSAAMAPKATLVFGEKNWTDRIHAECLSGLSTIFPYPIKGYQGHDTVMELARHDKLTPLLASLIG